MKEVVASSQLEKHDFRLTINETTSPDLDHSTLLDLFEQQVKMQSDRVAVIYQDEMLTYEQLDNSANQLANYLQTLGVSTEASIGTCLQRSLDIVIGLLAILKVGGAFVPLDPAYPHERITFILNDANISVLLTQEQFFTSFPPNETHVVCFEGSREQINSQSKERKKPHPHPANLAYVIYTSGSTGTPKGVQVIHRGVSNNIADLNQRFQITCEDRILCLSSLSFDMSVYELIGLLCAGGIVVLPEQKRITEVQYWAECINTYQVTVWHSAPALLERYVTHLSTQPDTLPVKLRLALLGGDWIAPTLPERLKYLFPAINVISLGGATEASIHSIIYPVGLRNAGWKSIPYGVPMANQKAYIFDESLHLTSLGEAGELYLGGIGLARGYWRQPDLTAERFLPDPFSSLPGARIYRTGDLALYHSDGYIELLGRIDHQIKIRGVRIELGEIESVARQHPAVETAAALACRVSANSGDEKILMLYFTLKAESQLSSQELRTFLAQQLPISMLPARLVQLSDLPLTPNGKIDRRMLAMLEENQPETTSSPDDHPPFTPLEIVVASLWCEALNCAEIGLYEDFFSLGGHSLLAMQITANCSELFPISLSIRVLFDFPTIVTFANYLLHLEPDCLHLAEQILLDAHIKQ